MTKSRNIIVGLLCILFALLPFHAFLTTWLNFLFFDPSTPPPVWLSLWKEMVVCVVIFLISIHFIKEKEVPKLDLVDKSLIAYFVLIALVYFFNSPDLTIKATLASLKYGAFFLVFFFFLKQLTFSFEERWRFVKILCWSGFISITFGLFLFFISGFDLLILFGYHTDPSTYFADRPISYCQLISNLDLCRNQATFSGPNQFASFLLILLPLAGFLAAPFYRKHKHGYLYNLTGRLRAYLFHQVDHSEDDVEQSDRKKLMIVFILAFISFLLTLTRSSWIGFAVSSFVFCYLFIRSRKIFWTIFLTLLILVVSSFLVLSAYKVGPIHEIIIRTSSSEGHASLSMQALESLWEKPMGYGLASVGAASRHLGAREKELITENWYLQVGLELGIIGIILFIAILFQVGYHFYRSYRQTSCPISKKYYLSITFSLIALSVMGMFLHVFESAATAYIFWGLAGVMYKRENIS